MFIEFEVMVMEYEDSFLSLVYLIDWDFVKRLRIS